MKLFDKPLDSNSNVLPYEGTVNYYGKIIDDKTADRYLEALMKNITWRNDEIFIFGRNISTRRKVAWYGDQSFEYRYSGSSKRALSWTNELREIKALVEEISGNYYNTCLLNLYHSGEEGMGWHSDDEPELKKHGAIASISLGAKRKFVLKHKKSQQKVEVILESGSLLVMKGSTQEHWLHRLPPTKKVKEPRVNLTFRTIHI